jgi:hypothetical protein
MPTKDKLKKAEYQKKWYEKNKKSHIKNVKANEAKVMEWYREYKKSLSCIKCGENHPACIQFHHRDPKQKNISVSLAPKKGWSVSRILTEINKCDVLCANCHFKTHHEDAPEAY